MVLPLVLGRTLACRRLALKAKTGHQVQRWLRALTFRVRHLRDREGRIQAGRIWSGRPRLHTLAVKDLGAAELLRA
jgi:hypothetical protein